MRAEQIAQARCAGRGSSRTSAVRGTRRAGTSPARRRSRARCRATRASRRMPSARARTAVVAPAVCGPDGRLCLPMDVKQRSGVVATRSTSMYWRRASADAFAQPQEQRRSAGAAAAKHDGNTRGPTSRSSRRPAHAFERRALRRSSARSLPGGRAGQEILRPPHGLRIAALVPAHHIGHMGRFGILFCRTFGFTGAAASCLTRRPGSHRACSTSSGGAGAGQGKERHYRLDELRSPLRGLCTNAPGGLVI